MNIANYWTLPAKEQKDVLKNNPVTVCALCDTEAVRLVSCDVCGRSVCFDCAMPAEGITITAKGASDEVIGFVLCNDCGTFAPPTRE